MTSRGGHFQRTTQTYDTRGGPLQRTFSNYSPSNSGPSRVFRPIAHGAMEQRPTMFGSDPSSNDSLSRFFEIWSWTFDIGPPRVIPGIV